MTWRFWRNFCGCARPFDTIQETNQITHRPAYNRFHHFNHGVYAHILVCVYIYIFLHYLNHPQLKEGKLHICLGNDGTLVESNGVVRWKVSQVIYSVLKLGGGGVSTVTIIIGTTFLCSAVLPLPRWGPVKFWFILSSVYGLLAQPDGKIYFPCLPRSNPLFLLKWRDMPRLPPRMFYLLFTKKNFLPFFIYLNPNPLHSS